MRGEAVCVVVGECRTLQVYASVRESREWRLGPHARVYTRTRAHVCREWRPSPHAPD